MIYLSRTPPFSLQKNAKFLHFLPLKQPLEAIFSKACALTLRKYVSKPDISIPNLSDKNFFFLLVAFLRLCHREVA